MFSDGKANDSKASLRISLSGCVFNRIVQWGLTQSAQLLILRQFSPVSFKKNYESLAFLRKNVHLVRII